MNVERMTARINELYHKSQNEGLTPEEKEEQAALRQAYVANVRANLRGQLDNISIVEKMEASRIWARRSGTGNSRGRKLLRPLHRVKSRRLWT